MAFKKGAKKEIKKQKPVFQFQKKGHTQFLQLINPSGRFKNLRIPVKSQNTKEVSLNKYNLSKNLQIQKIRCFITSKRVINGY